MSASPQLHRDSFHDLMTEQMRAAPWILLSAVMHLALGLLLFLFSGSESVEVPPPPLTMQAENIEEDDDLPVEIENPIEVPPVDPTITDVPDPTPTDDVIEPAEVWTDTPTDAPAENDSDVAMKDFANAGIIGTGSTGGGPMGQRRRGGRGKGPYGGGVRLAKDRALDWLADHQSRDGNWDGDGFMKEGDPTRGPLATGAGSALHDVGLTGLALLAFLGAGETHQSGVYRKNVRLALSWLRKRQDAEGSFAARTTERFTYDHAIATLAMVEAYAMTRSPLLRGPALQGLTFCMACQNPYGGWRYGERDGETDASVTGWMIMALKSGKMAGLPVDEQAVAWGVTALEKLTDEDTGRVGYIQKGSPVVREPDMLEAFPAAESEAMTAVGVLARVFGGHDPADDALIRAGGDLLTECLPAWDESRGSVDMYYWYYGSLAAFQIGGTHWRHWRRAMEEAVLGSQRGLGAHGKPDNFTGSWDPVGPWGKVGGRVYSTALMTLCLEVYYRYGRVFGVR